MAASAVKVNKKGALRLRRGHPWVFKSDVVSDAGAGAGPVTVVDERGQLLGTALHSPLSTIRLRLLSHERVNVNRALVLDRVSAALARRRLALPAADAYRAVHGEADHLPGIFVDRYGDGVTVQSTCAGADVLAPLVVDVLRELVSPRVIVVRNDAAARQHEKLRRYIEIAHGAPPTTVSYHEGALVLSTDLMADQKTGAYLDQSSNHVAAARYARGESLDCFTYHGGFALQLAAAGCSRVTAMDQSGEALARGRDNAERNRLAHIEWRQANVFDALPQLFAAGARYDVIVLDPPAFASTAKTLDAAGRAYKEINLRAMKLLRPGGTLVSCSCSGRLAAADFDAILADAARDTRHSVQVLERRGAGPDHPVLLGVPETEYLKCWI
ncbi:MAG: class I SAM-dependent rRNA methyltransferase, partial [Deltaproteobacteria bacterium]|nr:class I SAM-dependent rRNA methyltransferase [Deltaproteobacteria bacterium]